MQPRRSQAIVGDQFHFNTRFTKQRGACQEIGEADGLPIAYE